MFRCFAGEGWITALNSLRLKSVSSTPVKILVSFFLPLFQNLNYRLLAMPATQQIQHNTAGSRRYSSYKDGPDPRVQLPQLPKQLEGKFVRGQMYTRQDSLPKLPVPPLDQTLRKYITGIQVMRRVLIMQQAFRPQNVFY
jgi:hypothetical protein